MSIVGQRVETIRQGSSIGDLQNLYDDRAELNAELRPNDNLELNLNFAIGVPFLKQTGDALNSELENRGVDKWTNQNTYVLVDEENRTMRVRWQHGNPWTGIVIAIILGLALVALILWQLNKAIPEFEERLPEIIRSSIPLLAIAGVLLIIIPLTRLPAQEERPP